MLAELAADERERGSDRDRLGAVAPSDGCGPDAFVRLDRLDCGWSAEAALRLHSRCAR